MAPWTAPPGRVAGAIALLAAGAGAASCGEAAGPELQANARPSKPPAAFRCDADNGGLTLPAGFCATVFADSIGHARHMAVAPNGDVYAITWSGPYYSNDEGARREGGFVVAMRDGNRDGRADSVIHFGGSERGNTGGTGIALYGGHLYADAGDRIVRFPMREGVLVPTGQGEVVVSGFPTTGSHPQHNFVIDSAGTLYANMGSATNSCQRKDRTTGSPGIDPCAELATRAGIWRFDANRTNQRFTASARYATGIRNAVGLAIGPGNALYATQHGRDQLFENWGEKFTAEQGQELPAEELLRVTEGQDYGWPYCYYDHTQSKRVTAPEYGGDGRMTTRCESFAQPVATFPAHWAPNDLVFYRGTQFPAKYRNGVFIAFHGSWNRAPGPQGGYQVAFLPFEGDRAGTRHETFASGFPGAEGAAVDPSRARYRPSGVAVGADGALYVSDDRVGRIWRITYGGEGEGRGRGN